MLLYFHLGDGFVDACFVIIKLYLFLVTSCSVLHSTKASIETKVIGIGGDTNPRDPREISSLGGCLLLVAHLVVSPSVFAA